MQQRYTAILLLILSFAANAALLAQGTNFKDYILRKGENLAQKTSQNIFIRVSSDKRSCYVGEPVVVTYKLYTRLGNISNIAKSPAFNGFSVIDLAEPEMGTSTNIEVLNGREYYTSIIRKAQLYPMQPGVSTLGEAVIESKLRFTREEFIAQFDENGEPEFITGATQATACFDTTAMIGSEPLFIDVKALPGNTQPVSFHGAVGNYVIEALVEKDNITTDETGKLRVLLTGEGNMTLVPAPEVEFPAGLEAFEPSVKDGLNRLMVPVSGSKIFDYSFTAAKEGDYTIPSIVFSFFDIDSGRYKTIRTKPVVVHIKKGTGKIPVIEADKLNPPQSFAETMFTHRWMIILPVALLIILGLVIWVRWDKKKQQAKLTAMYNASREAAEDDSIPLNPLLQSELMLVRNEPRLFYEILDKELHVFLAQKLQLPVETISKKSIAAALDKKGIPVAESLAIQKLLDDVALQLYTPSTDESKTQEFFVEAVRLVKKL
jgi:BatD DUF11 like domain